MYVGWFKKEQNDSFEVNEICSIPDKTFSENSVNIIGLVRTALPKAPRSVVFLYYKEWC